MTTSIVYKTDKYKIILPNILILVKTNVLSLQLRTLDKKINNCIKDYNRLCYIKNICNTFNFNKGEYVLCPIKYSLWQTKNNFNREFENILKYPYSIYSMDNTHEEKELYLSEWKIFLKLGIKKQTNVIKNHTLFVTELDKQEKNEEIIERITVEKVKCVNDGDKLYAKTSNNKVILHKKLVIKKVETINPCEIRKLRSYFGLILFYFFNIFIKLIFINGRLKSITEYKIN